MSGFPAARCAESGQRVGWLRVRVILEKGSGDLVPQTPGSSLRASGPHYQVLITTNLRLGHGGCPGIESWSFMFSSVLIRSLVATLGLPPEKRSKRGLILCGPCPEGDQTETQWSCHDEAHNLHCDRPSCKPQGVRSAGSDVSGPRPTARPEPESRKPKTDQGFEIRRLVSVWC